MKHRSRSAFLILLIGTMLFAGCGGGSERLVLRGGTRHLPLLHDRVLRYREFNGDEERTYTLRTTYAGGRISRVFNVFFKGIEAGRCTFISKDSLVYFTTSQPLTPMTDLPSYRSLWVNEQAEEGDTWVDEDTGTEVTFVGYQPATVPAGTFEKCYTTVSTVLPVFMDSVKAWHRRGVITQRDYDVWNRNKDIVIRRWFAPGLGLVKEQIGGPEHTRELVAIVRPGSGQSDAPPPEIIQTPTDTTEKH
jgi:hypothetical protein